MSTEIVHMERGGGKTQRLIEKVLDDPTAVYVAASSRRVRNALDLAIIEHEKRTGKRITKIPLQALGRRFVSIPQWQDGYMRGRQFEKVYIDDIEDVLAMLFGQVAEVTTSILPTAAVRPSDTTTDQEQS